MNDPIMPFAIDPADWPTEKPLNNWNNATLVERFDVRVRVRSTIAMLPESLGPGTVQQPHPSDDEPQVTHYNVDGEVLIFEDRILIRYPEHPSTGLGDCDTYFTYWTEFPNYLELCRIGSASFHFSFDPQRPRQSVTFQTPFGAFEPVVTLKEMFNLMENGVGSIFVDYTMDFNNLYSQAVSLRVDIRRLRPGETRLEFSLSPEEIEQLEKLTGDIDRVKQFAAAPRPKPTLDEIRLALEQGSAIPPRRDPGDGSGNGENE